MFGNGKSVGEDWSAARVRPPQRSGFAQPAATLHRSQTISSISSEMTVVGKIVCKGILKIYGVVEGELNASNAFIAEGARIQGDIVAEELTIAGRVKGNIHALRVKLQGNAVVEGDIFHQSLSIEENVSFVGRSQPEHYPPELLSSIAVESSNPQPQPQALLTVGDEGAFDGESNERESHEKEPKQPARDGMRVFLAACIAIMAISVVGYFALSAIQQPTGLAYATDAVHVDPSWIERSTESH